MYTKIGKRIKIYVSDKDLKAEIVVFKEFQYMITLTFLVIGFMIATPYFILSRFLNSLFDGDLFILIFFLFWLFAVVQLFHEWLWLFFGKEIVLISHDQIKHRRSIFGLGLTKSFDKKEFKNIRASGYFEPEKPIKKYSKKFGIKLGSISIDYDDLSYRFGIRLKEKEAVELATQLNNFLTNAWSRRREDCGFT